MMEHAVRGGNTCVLCPSLVEGIWRRWKSREKASKVHVKDIRCARRQCRGAWRPVGTDIFFYLEKNLFRIRLTVVIEFVLREISYHMARKQSFRSLYSRKNPSIPCKLFTWKYYSILYIASTFWLEGVCVWEREIIREDKWALINTWVVLFQSWNKACDCSLRWILICSPAAYSAWCGHSTDPARSRDAIGDKDVYWFVLGLAETSLWWCHGRPKRWRPMFYDR